jgi:hypothetical protein
MNYGEVTTKFTKLVNRRDATPDLIDYFLQEGINRIQRDLRGPLNEKSLVATIGSQYDGLIIPGDFLELIRLEPMPASAYSEVRMLRSTDLDTAKTLALSVGTPMRVFARQGKKWFIGGPPKQGDQIRIDYYSEFTPLSLTTDTNILTKVGSKLMLRAGLVEAMTWFRDTDRKLEAESDYNETLSEHQAQGDDDDLSADATVSPVLQFPSDLNE